MPLRIAEMRRSLASRETKWQQQHYLSEVRIRGIWRDLLGVIKRKKFIALVKNFKPAFAFLKFTGGNSHVI
jgi:hypothetical protein